MVLSWNIQDAPRGPIGFEDLSIKTSFADLPICYKGTIDGLLQGISFNSKIHG